MEEGLSGDHQFEFLVLLMNVNDSYSNVMDGTLFVFNGFSYEGFLFLNFGVQEVFIFQSMGEKLILTNLNKFKEGCAKKKLFNEMVPDSEDFDEVPVLVSDFVSEGLRGTNLVVENPNILNTGEGW